MSTVDDSSASELGEEKPLSTAVVEAVSSASETPLLELPPLCDAIDPDALDTLFSGSHTDRRLEFRYAGCLVTVHGNGTVDVSTGI